MSTRTSGQKPGGVMLRTRGISFADRRVRQVRSRTLAPCVRLLLRHSRQHGDIGGSGGGSPYAPKQNT